MRHRTFLSTKILALIITSIVITVAGAAAYLIHNCANKVSYATTAIMTQDFTPLAQNINTLQGNNTHLNTVLYIAAILIIGLYFTYHTSRVKLYKKVSYIPTVIFTLLSATFCYLSHTPLLSITTLAISTMSLINFISMNHNKNNTFSYRATYSTINLSGSQLDKSSSNLFCGAFWLGLLPLLYPSTIVYLILIFLAIPLFARTIRDIFVVILAYILPFAIDSYVRWMYGLNFDDLLSIYHNIMVTNGTIFATSESFMWAAAHYFYFLAPMPLLYIIALIGAIRSNNISITARAKQRFLFSNIFIALSLVMFFTSSFNPTSLVTIIAPLALSLPLTIAKRY